jgi:hypothetical protein
VWEYVAGTYFAKSSPSPPSSVSSSPGISYTTIYSTDIDGSVTSTISAITSPASGYAGATTTPYWSGSATADISTSVCVLTKTIVETIVIGGTVSFETKTYGGEFTQSYLVRPTDAMYVEVDIPAIDADDFAIEYSSGSSGSSTGSSSGQVGWYFDENGNRQWGDVSAGYDYIVIEEYVLSFN